MWDDRPAQGGSCLQGRVEVGGGNLSLWPPEVPSASLPPLGRAVRSKGKRPQGLLNPQYSTACVQLHPGREQESGKKSSWEWTLPSPSHTHTHMHTHTSDVPPSQPRAGSWLRKGHGETWQKAGHQVPLLDLDWTLPSTQT